MTTLERATAFPDALNKALCSPDHRWFFESKYGGAPMSPAGVTWRLDRLWRIVDETEDLGRWFKRIKLHCMFPAEWRGHFIPMHRHHPGAVVIGLGSYPSGTNPLYINRVAPPLGAFNETLPIADHVMSPPFAYRLDRDSEHSVGFVQTVVGKPFYTITLIPSDGLEFDKWPPSADSNEIGTLFARKSLYVDWIEKHFGSAHEGRKMTDG